MPNSPNIERDHQKVGETILLCVRQLLAQSGETGVARVLALGPWHETAERTVTTALQAHGDRVQHLRAFGHEEELCLWESRFGPIFPEVRPRWLHLEEDLLTQGLKLGQFDLLVTFELDGAHETGLGLLTNLKRLLKRNGLLLLEITIESADDWKQALARAGFEGVVARSDRATGQPSSGRDFIVARSDGCVQIQTATNADPTPLGDRVRNEPKGASSGPSPAQHSVRRDQPIADSAVSSIPTMSPDAVRDRVITLLEQMLQLSKGDLDTSSPFIEFGLDSIAGVRFVNELNQQLHLELKPTVLFDYGSVEKLSTFVAEECRPLLAEVTPGPTPLVGSSSPRSEQTSRSSPASAPSLEIVHRDLSPTLRTQPLNSDVAVIGMSGRFPHAENVGAFWRNLMAGKSCIGEVPPERWDHSLIYESGSRKPNKTNSKWGGFLADADKFDPLFFNISGREAEATDPQHRLFLEECYHAIEDAGYAGPSTKLLQKCGVFAGVEPGDYLSLLTNLSEQSENSPVFQGNAESILAARISYFLDLKGPSIAVNTACSSSLVAIHLACQSLVNGECDLALAGGVRVFSSDKAYLALGNMGMLSTEGQCKTFDEEANGFVPGEAVGVLVLKPLSTAIRDGDHVYGVIKGSAINQDGRTNGITAPSSLSQTQVELEVYKKFGLHPETLQYVEAHGTGTKLGDPIEIEALTQSFRRFTVANGFCAIGSVKTNIGHTMAAAGVCSVIKVLLALRHRSIPPSLNLRKTNPYIDFENSPFFVNTTLRDWPITPGRPRRAAISSFGFSGTNSHLVLEEAPEKSVHSPTGGGVGASRKPAYLVTVSAKTTEALQQSLGRLLEWLRIEEGVAELEEISFTLNAGRSHFEHRCAVVASSTGELAEALARLVKGEETSIGWRSNGRKNDSGDAVIFRQVIATVLKELPEASRQGEAACREKLAALAALYARNYDLDYILLHHGEAHRRISLPAYPFARERYWIPEAAAAPRQKPGLGPSRLHPLVHRNVSTLTQTKFESIFDGREFFFDDHQIRGEKILPGVAYLEMAVSAIRMAMEGARFNLTNVAWMRPLAATEARKITICLLKEGEDVRFEILSGDAETLHAQGKAVPAPTLEGGRPDRSAIRVRCTETESPENIYRRCVDAGLNLGQAFRTIRSIWFTEDEALARLELPEALSSAAQEFTLHPGLMDGALQATAVLCRGETAGLPVPFAVTEVRFNRLESKCYAYVRRRSEENGLLRFDISLLADSGEVLAELKGLAMRALRPKATAGEPEVIFVRPTWEDKPSRAADAGQLAGRLLLLDTEESLANEISLRSPGLEIMRVVPDANFSVHGKVIGVRPDRPEDFNELLGLGRPDFVIHRWEEATNERIGLLERSILPLFQLTRALIRHGAHAPTKLLMTYPPGADPAYPAVAGYARTLRQERPNLHLKVLETERIETTTLIAELLDSSRDQEIRLRDGRREVKRLEIFTPELTSSTPFRERGVYVIAGGLGGLGRIFARYLAKRCRARLVLLGRSEIERPPFLAELETLGAQALFLRADVSHPEEVVAAVREVNSRFGDIHGVIHAAGVIRDGFVLNKTTDDFSAVLASKMRGAVSLDEATRKEALDFFVLFSSMASVFGNVGQSDYAYANCFLDEFARSREQQRARGVRSGRTVSVNWPLWRNGGMRQTANFERLKLTEIGLAALEDDVGLAIFETALQSNEPQLMGLVGQQAKVRSLIASPEDRSGDAQAGLTRSGPVQSVGNDEFQRGLAKSEGMVGVARGPQRVFADLRESVLSYLTTQFSKLVKIPATRIQANDPLEKYGIDSIMVMEFTQRLESDFGELSKTLLFEHQTLAELVGYFLANHADRLPEILESPVSKVSEVSGSRTVGPSASRETIFANPPDLPSESGDDIAIIGLFGRYPMADDLEQFWENLRTGKDCIVEIPRERWDYRLFYDPEPGKFGKTPNKWGGFLNDIERFDAQFFSITPREASALDPQERVFLETVWRTVEDAGYRKSALVNRKVGVFVGVMYGEYQLYGAGDIAEGKVFPLSSSYASIANRVSYIFNWHGPSMAIDTMCSSSLTAIHLACESLRRGESELAIAGGVNATLHPHKDILLSPGGFAASDGRCRSFGEGGDGYVPGEGVGAVLLKPLTKAIADGDHVYAVVKASTINHGGKTNGYTVPNPKAQAELIIDALLQGKVAPQSLNYIEAHGTGTALGDPIEIAGLTKAFRETGVALDGHSCAIGSVKSNIGHLESAAGIAGVTKILLQMRHGQIAPSLHSEKLNPHINFADSAFYVPQALQEWKPPEVEGGLPIRRAGISSFGAGGANAHLILEEFVGNQSEESVDRAVIGPFLFILSAKTDDRLRTRAGQLLEYFQRPASGLASLPDIAYTLQVGREPLGERLAFVASDVPEARRGLQQFLAGEMGGEICRGSVRADGIGAEPLLEGEEGRAFLDALIRQQKWIKLAQFWVSGGQVEWEKLHQNQRRVPLPTYPFAGERYWAPDHVPNTSRKQEANSRLHPLIDRNVSDFDGQTFLTVLDRDDFAPSGTSQKLLPGLWLLEMGAVAARLSSKESWHRIVNVAWSAPQVIAKPLNLVTKVFEEGGNIRFEICADEAEGEILVQGSLLPDTFSVPEKADLNDLRQRCPRRVESGELTPRLTGIGLPSADSTSIFPEFWRGDHEVLMRFRRSTWDSGRFGECDLPPVLLEVALEAVRFLEFSDSETRLAPVSLASSWLEKLPADGWCHVSVIARGASVNEKTVEIRFLDPEGAIVASLNDLILRVFQPEESPAALFLRPVWEERAAPIPVAGLLNGRLLLFDPDTALMRDIQLRHPALSVTRVVPGDRFAQENGLIQINPQAEADYEKLIETPTPDYILYRWASTSLMAERVRELSPNLEPGTSNRSGLQLEAALELGIFSLFLLTRKLLQRNLQSEVRLLFCYPSGKEPAFQAIGAFAKTLAQEQPKLQLRVLQTNEMNSALLTEFFSRQDEREILRQNGKRLIRTFEQVVPQTNAKLPLRQEGVYLLTGGLGGLGNLFAIHLAKVYRARLVLAGRSALRDEARAKMAEIEAAGGQVLYVSGDAARIEDAREIVRSAKHRFGALHGVIHAAGILRDSFLLKKEFGDFVDVLRPKVQGVVALDEATKDEPLDFFALFSSTAGAFGNAGQSDYAYANGFLDAFASAREVRRSAGERNGRTISINWSLWKDGGMSITGQNVERHLQQIGLYPLSRTTGIGLFEMALCEDDTQLVALWGIRSKLNQTFLNASNVEGESPSEPADSLDESALSQRVETYLKETLAEVTELPVTEIDSDLRFEEFGVDSIVVTDFNLRLEKGFGPLPKTLLFEFPNFRELTRHLVAAFKPQITRFLGKATSPESARWNNSRVQTGWNLLKPLPQIKHGRAGSRTDEEIAIIGLAGRYPMASDLRAFWQILQSGTDCVTEIPKDRWDIDRYYDPDPNKAAEGKMYSRWGAFLDDVDKFDPLFFNIAPVEAELMDPQERLFLQTAWNTLEDAGYTRSDLARWLRKEYATNVGVFVGVTTNTYSFVARDNAGARAMPTTLPWSLANRVSYLFNFSGPSIPVDTACSSSLTAIHLACEAIRNGTCQQAIAGGVNLYLHPSKFVSLCLTRMLSTEGKCRAFGEGGDGFVPGEGVGAVLLKPLSLALADGDHVYGLIKATAVNHGGRSNGYTVPNPAAQAELISHALEQSAIDPGTLSYFEAHGTGTALGDPIEVDGLAKAFGAINPESQFTRVCSLGSVKTNIGHLEAAAGIAGLTKVLLQMKHRQLVPSLHANQINSNITFEGTPFRVQRELEEWRPAENGASPRRAGISSFGAGGANAFMVVEEFIAGQNQATGTPPLDFPALIVLSARNSDRLKRTAENLAEFLTQSPDAESPLPSVAYTLQIGREALEERVAFVAVSRPDLISKLRRIGLGDWKDTHCGRVKRERIKIAADAAALVTDPAAVEALKDRDLDRLAGLWVEGVPISWPDQSNEEGRQRISLPGYPFTRERYWVPLLENPDETMDRVVARLHPLLHRNESTLNGQKYESRFSGEEVVLRDHQLSGQKVLPGAASLELALAGASRALENVHVRLLQVVWIRPLAAGASDLEVELLLRPESDQRVSFALKGPNGEVHVQGKAEVIAGWSEESFDLNVIQDRCLATILPDVLYPAFADRGLQYGPGFRVIQEIKYNDREVLSTLQVSQDWGHGEYRLHPAIVDGALQSLAAIGAGANGMDLPFAVDLVECSEPLPERCYAYGRIESEEDGLRRYEVKLLDDHGKVLARLSGLSVRRFERSNGELQYYRPVWNSEPIRIESSVDGPILLLDEGTDLVEALERRVGSVVRVVPGDSYQRTGNVITIRRENAEDYERLAQEVSFSAVIHRWSQRGSRLEEALERGLYSVHRLAQALLKSSKGVPWVYAYPLGETAYEAVGGYAKSLRQEQPEHRLKTLGLDGTPADLVSELNDPRLEVRYRDGHREVPALEDLPTPTGSSDNPFKRQGVYFLSGGAGGLATIFAEYLVRAYDARLILTGRSELSEAKRRELEKIGDQVLYLRADVSRLAGASQAVHDAKQRFGSLNGVIHAAGALRDGLIRHKKVADIEAVLAPKVWGVESLDAATSEEPLDLFVLFSSTAGLLGNAGQSDYAYANAYLDSFAHRREELRRAGRRSGRTVSLNWPLWRDGGMLGSEETVRFQTRELGLRPLETTDGLAAFSQALSSGESQCAIFFGTPQKLFARINGGPAKAPDHRRQASKPLPQTESKELKTQLFSDLKRFVGKVLRLDVEFIEVDADTSEYGFDSITFTALANELNAAFGFEITPAVLFEYRTLEEFIDFLCREHGDQLVARYSLKGDSAEQPNAKNEESFESGAPSSVVADEIGTPVPSNGEMAFQRPGLIHPPTAGGPEFASYSPEIKNSRSEPIAIVGMSGLFPGSPDLDAFWRNLDEGKDLIGRASHDRWSFSTSANHGSAAQQIEPPWGGFIPEPDKFDPLFFDISPREAELMDPQQRLFLQTVWHTLEDAGYKKADFAATKTGLFVGVAANDYANLLAVHGVPVEAYSSTGNSHSVLANRVSYFFDLHGPSEAIDTACSSSLVAIHRAMESIASGSSEMAIVGGVNVLLSPGAFLAFGKAGMLCEDGRCKTFDVRADGYVRGEGVGAILLKPLSRAQQDGDRIYAVIRGTGENHGGHVQSLTVPNPNAQGELLRDVYARAGIDPFTISYIEAHGTGTSLGDPIEINGLKKAFGQNLGDVPKPRCAVGSVKANVGHLETAAGIAGVIKALLAIHHRRIPGNVNLQQLNPYIQVDGTPFCFPQRSEPWEPLRDRRDRPIPRRVGVSSFGFGGSNAHVLLEEYSEKLDVSEKQKQVDRPELFIFSARDAARLKQLVINFVAYLGRPAEDSTKLPSADLRSIAYTLQVGREPMNERLAVIASTVPELSGQLAKFLQEERSDLFYGNVVDGKAGLQLLRQVHEDNHFLGPLITGRQLAKLARLWVSGLEVNWGELWTGHHVRRASLPGYPFDRQRYWIPTMANRYKTEVVEESRLHALLHRNESTLKVQRYGSQFTGEEIVFRDHRVNGQKLFPGAASLELALAGAILALENSKVGLRQVAWTRPIVAGENGVGLKLVLRPEADRRVSFELQSPSGEAHVSGRAEVTAGFSREPLDLKAIRARCHRKLSSGELYTLFAERGLEYGPGFRAIVEIGCGTGEVLSTIEVPPEWGEGNYRLHPALVDGALQSLAMMGAGRSEGLELPFAVNEVECRGILPKRCYAYGRIEGDQGEVRRYEIKLLGEDGEVLAHLGGLATRRLEASAKDLLYYRPCWIPDPLPVGDLPPSPSTVLLLDETTGLEETLAARGIASIRVVPGAVYERDGNVLRIRWDRAEDYARLVREIEFGGVIHRWSRQGVTLNESLERGLYSVHQLIRALLKGGKAMPFVYAYPGGEVAYQAIAGYAKSLRQEQPKLRLKTVGVEDASYDLLPELNNAQLEVCYRERRREVRSLEELPELPATQTLLKKGGVYLLSGGAGGLGKIFAEYLIQKYDARLVLVGRSELTETKRLELASLGDHAVYVRADISTTDGAEFVVRQVKQQYGVLNGVIHAAGELRDGLIWNKEREDIEAVLAGKVMGVEALDAATRQEPLDCFVLFSSIAGLFGNAGQSDYAYGNAYLDAFAHQREELRRSGGRSGRTLSLNWPLWSDGGLGGNLRNGRSEALGLVPLDRHTGLQIFETAFASGEVQVWGGLGNREKIRALLLKRSPQATEKQSVLPSPPSEPNAKSGTPDMGLDLTNYLIQQFAALTKMEARQIRAAESLEKYGFDSIMAVEFSQQLENDFGDLSKTLLFEYPTLEALAGYFLENHRERLAEMWPRHPAESRPATTSKVDQGAGEHDANGPVGKNLARFLTDFEPLSANEDVAVIGVFGRYPQADNLDQFWINLVEGRDCVEEIPFERWDYRLYFDPQPGTTGRSYNKWGGFLRDVDKFDPLFFNISPREAEIIDPQERLFLETVWNTVEDAGYSRRALAGQKIGVFVGVMYGQYQLFGVEESLRRGEVTTLSSSYASIANRVSYFFDWRGPSLAVDTMCSSALMSIHLACESLKRGESQMAVAGGVNVILHPHKDVGLSQAGFLNKEGRCRSFGKTAGRGYVPGEGVGSVLLKPLSAAIRERDHIYGVIKATVVNHSGKTIGYATPNPNAQAELIVEGFRKAKIDPRTISYVEAAATGSALGDPMEVSGLTKAFRQSTKDQQFCAIGSVKSNSGHLESASGIAGLTKALLQLKHRKLVPSVHTEELNPEIHWETTPFFVQRKLADWQPIVIDGSTLLRRAGVNAFGAGGSNAHLILEEYPEVSAERNALPFNHPSTLIVLSAKDGNRLMERASDLVAYLIAGTAEEVTPRLLDVAYTLQIGREPMEERLAFLADTLESAIQKLTLFVTEAAQIPGLYRGCISSEVPADPVWQTNDTVNGVPEESIRSGNLNKLAAWWVTGGEPDWQNLHQGFEPRRISLPTYRFARERCWFSEGERNDALINKEQNQNSETIGERATNHRILNEIRQLLGSVLKLSPARIGSRQNMAECGLDSVTTVAFLRELERRYSIQVSVSSLIEYPTLESLVSFLSEHHFEALSSGAENELGVPGGSNGSAILARMSGFHGNGLNGGSTDYQENGTGLADRKQAPRTMTLGSLDYLFVGPRRFAIQVLYYFESHLNFVRLQSGLRTVAEAFYPINSHLVRHREEYQISECADDPDFAEIFCDESTVPPIQDRPETFAPFLVQFDPRLPTEKLAKFRLFQLASGSLLSVNVSHAIADGYSFYYFLSSWAAACRGESFSPPAFNRPGRHSLLEVDKANPHGFGELAFSFPFLEAGFDPTTSRVETLHFDGASLLSEARDAADETSRHKITENSLLTALVWQAYARALGAEAGELVLACPIDFRRISPELSPSFFGNASAPALLRLERKLVLAESVTGLAAMISDAIRSCDELTLARYQVAIDHLRRAGGLEATENVALVNPRNGLIVTNVARFPLPPIDFGTGPFRREFTPTNYAGTAVIVGGEGSTLKVRLSLPDLPSR